MMATLPLLIDNMEQSRGSKQTLQRYENDRNDIAANWSKNWHQHIAEILGPLNCNDFLFNSFITCCYSAATATNCCRDANAGLQQPSKRCCDFILYSEEQYLAALQFLLTGCDGRLLPACVAFYEALRDNQHVCGVLVSQNTLESLYSVYSESVATILASRGIDASTAIYNTAYDVFLAVDSELQGLDSFVERMQYQFGSMFRESMLTFFKLAYNNFLHDEMLRCSTSGKQNVASDVAITMNKSHVAAAFMLSSYYQRYQTVIDSLNALCAHVLSYAMTTPLVVLLSDVFNLLTNTSSMIAIAEKNQKNRRTEYVQLLSKYDELVSSLKILLASLFFP